MCSIRNDLTGWRTRIINGKCTICKQPINTKEGYFKLTIEDANYDYSMMKYNVFFCSKCLGNFRNQLGQQKPDDLNKEYETKYKLAMIRGIERGNGH